MIYNEITNGLIYSEYIDKILIIEFDLEQDTPIIEINQEHYKNRTRDQLKLNLLSFLVKKFFDEIWFKRRFSGINPDGIMERFYQHDYESDTNTASQLIQNIKKNLKQNLRKNKFPEELIFISKSPYALNTESNFKAVDLKNPYSLMDFLILLKNFFPYYYEIYSPKLRVISDKEDTKKILKYFNKFEVLKKLNQIKLKEFWDNSTMEILPIMLETIDMLENNELHTNLIKELKNHIFYFYNMINNIDQEYSDQRLVSLGEAFSNIQSKIENNRDITDRELQNIKAVIQEIRYPLTNHEFIFNFGGGTWGNILKIEVNKTDEEIKFIISKKNDSPFKNSGDLYLKIDNNDDLNNYIKKGEIKSGETTRHISFNKNELLQVKDFFIFVKNTEGISWSGTSELLSSVDIEDKNNFKSDNSSKIHIIQQSEYIILNETDSLVNLLELGYILLLASFVEISFPANDFVFRKRTYAEKILSELNLNIDFNEYDTCSKLIEIISSKLKLKEQDFFNVGMIITQIKLHILQQSSKNKSEYLDIYKKEFIKMLTKYNLVYALKDFDNVQDLSIKSIDEFFENIIANLQGQIRSIY